ncbi:MAG: hypothetical protein OXF86_05515 [Caldilineaceae bacterium]|nr:hypothetical protein [Caldilineaceae bacterium]
MEASANTSYCDVALLLMPIVQSYCRIRPIEAFNFREVDAVFLPIYASFLLVPLLAHTFIVAETGGGGNSMVVFSLRSGS